MSELLGLLSSGSIIISLLCVPVTKIYLMHNHTYPNTIKNMSHEKAEPDHPLKN